MEIHSNSPKLYYGFNAIPLGYMKPLVNYLIFFFFFFFFGGGGGRWVWKIHQLTIIVHVDALIHMSSRLDHATKTWLLPYILDIYRSTIEMYKLGPLLQATHIYNKSTMENKLQLKTVIIWPFILQNQRKFSVHKVVFPSTANSLVYDIVVCQVEVLLVSHRSTRHLCRSCDTYGTAKKKRPGYLVGKLVATNLPIEKALHAIGYNQIPTK